MAGINLSLQDWRYYGGGDVGYRRLTAEYWQAATTIQYSPGDQEAGLGYYLLYNPKGQIYFISPARKIEAPPLVRQILTSTCTVACKTDITLMSTTTYIPYQYRKYFILHTYIRKFQHCLFNAFFQLTCTMICDNKLKRKDGKLTLMLLRSYPRLSRDNHEKP